LRSLRMI